MFVLPRELQTFAYPYYLRIRDIRKMKVGSYIDIFAFDRNHLDPAITCPKRQRTMRAKRLLRHSVFFRFVKTQRNGLIGRFEWRRVGTPSKIEWVDTNRPLEINLSNRKIDLYEPGYDGIFYPLSTEEDLKPPKTARIITKSSESPGKIINGVKTYKYKKFRTSRVMFPVHDPWAKQYRVQYKDFLNKTPSQLNDKTLIGFRGPAIRLKDLNKLPRVVVRSFKVDPRCSYMLKNANKYVKQNENELKRKSECNLSTLGRS